MLAVSKVAAVHCGNH